MTSPNITRRLLPVVAALSAPALIVFVILVAAGKIDPWPALLGAAATLLLTALLLRPYMADVAAVARYARELGRGEEVAAPRLSTEVTADILSALCQFRRAWRLQGEEMASLIGFHETLFDSLPSPLFLLNAQRRIVRSNLAARNTFGRQQQGRDLAAVMRNPDILDAADRVLLGAAGVQVDFGIPGPVEREFRAMVEPLPHIGIDGTVAVLWLHDVTALKQIEQMRADFVANASHELRTPLAALLGFIETLQGPAHDDAEARERFLAIMYEQASRMTRLVTDLLNLSRIELHEHLRPAGRADVAALLRRVATGLELQAGRRKMRIELDLAETLPAVIGEEDELAQIFQNLLDNALKYGREGTAIEVTGRLTNDLPPSFAERNGPAIAIAVKDRGEGIAREHLPRLTERFFRVDTARSRRLGGTGLGLAIVKHVVNRHRGLLTIDSVPGEGSTFTVYLPVAA